MEIADIVTAVGVGTMLTLGAVGMYVYILYRRLVQKVDQMVAKIIQEAEENMIGIDIELDNGMYFCYNSQDKQYICQGATVAEIRQAFGKRFPEKTAYLAGGDPGVVAELKTELLKLGTNENSTGQ